MNNPIIGILLRGVFKEKFQPGLTPRITLFLFCDGSLVGFLLVAVVNFQAFVNDTRKQGFKKPIDKKASNYLASELTNKCP
jgi:hypothetical protein